MKSNKYSDLIKFGLKPRTLMTLSESDVDRLHKSLIKGKKKKETTEAQVTTKTEPTKVVTGIKPGDVVPTGGASAVQFVNSTTAELKNSEVKESGTNKKNNPYAICTAEMGKQFGTRKRSKWTSSQEEKYEACKAQVEKSLKEGKKYFDILLERKIVSLLETHLNPKMTKGDLIRLIEAKKQKMKKPIGKIGSFGVKTEDKDSDTITKPKPTTKPDRTTTPSRPKKNPGRNPRPDTKPDERPKARKTEFEVNEVMTAPTKPKPTTKPDRTTTPSRPKKNPGRNPNPEVKPDERPKANKAEEAKNVIINAIKNLIQK